MVALQGPWVKLFIPRSTKAEKAKNESIRRSHILSWGALHTLTVCTTYEGVSINYPYHFVHRITIYIYLEGGVSTR